MTFIDNILKYRNVAVVGLEKNTGKTECLNYIISNIKDKNLNVAVTSIGIDGETTDQVYGTNKPEITIYENMIFVTSEKQYRLKRITSEIRDIFSRSTTAMGRLVIAKAKNRGKIILSGPPDTTNLKTLLDELRIKHNCTLTLVDGALSRLSFGAPAITDAMILCTGAAVSINLNELIKKTNFVYRLINLPQTTESFRTRLSNMNTGIWAIDNDNDIHDLGISSVFTLNKEGNDIFKYGHKIFVAGAVNNSMLTKMSAQNKYPETILYVKDFTRLFITPEALQTFVKKGNKIVVMDKPNLIAITINPVAPSGYVINPEMLKDEMEKALNIPVFNIKNM